MHLLHQRISKNRRAVLLLGIVAGFLLFAGLRLILAENTSVHYHANFGLYIDGKRDKFDNFTFYEEVAACSGANDPRHRAHLHDNKNNVIHVHDGDVTWGAFFANLGYGLTDKLIQTDDAVYIDGSEKELRFMLNGVPVDSVVNRIIESEDVLLVDFGKDSDLNFEYGLIEKDAGQYNQKADPASCSGETKLSFEERIERAFDFRK